MTSHEDDPQAVRPDPAQHEEDGAERRGREETDGGPGSHTEDGSGGVTDDDPASGGTTSD